MTGGSFNGVELNAAQYRLYETFSGRINPLYEKTPAEIRQLENDLRRDILNVPGSPLRPLVWEMVQTWPDLLDPEFAAEAMVAYLTEHPLHTPSLFNTSYAMSALPRPALLRAQALLHECLAKLDETRRAVLAEVLKRLNDMLELEKRGLIDTPEGAEAWVKSWLMRVQDGFYHTAHPPYAPPATGQMSAVLHKLLALDSKDYRPATNHPGEFDYQSNTFAGAWLTGLQEALVPILKSPLSAEDTTLILQRFIEEQSTPITRIEQDAWPFEPTLYQLVDANRDRLTAYALAALRRSLTQADAYRPLTDLKWVNDVETPELNPGEAWSDAFLAKLDALPAQERAPWPALMAFARSASAGKPSGKWLKDAQKHLEAVGAANFRVVLTPMLPLLSKPRTFALQPVQYGPDPNLVLDEFNALSLKGLLWMLPLATDAALTRTLSGVVETALKKVPGIGPRAPKIANAAVYALSQIESEAALSALARLSTTVTFKGTLKEVQKALDVVAKRLNVTPDDLLDMGTPTLGLTSVGERLDVLGDTEARLTVDASGAHLSFSKGGKPLKSVPAAVKKHYKDELADLKTAQKEAEKTVSALAARLDSLMIQPKTWTGAAWLERYLDHPLAGTVARRLIWLVDGIPCLYHNRMMHTVDDIPVLVMEDSEVKLWHPIGRPVDEVLAWRSRLEALNIRQPFKQAWREVYVLTDAERRTDTYSNRFAGHILKQHQFNALASLRGWRNKLRLMVDDSYPPAMRDLPAYGLRAEYWIEGIGENYGEDSTDSGTYLRLTTDQVRFYPIDAPENHAHAGGGGYTQWVNQTQQPTGPLHMADIPPLVLSEILRDVDLFVGVASVGNDPTWQDGGPGGRFREYWQSYSFGELTETAKTRAEYLKRLLPRLKIKDRLELDGRFLKVRGDRRTYKIHLGSSNILMEPNDQYLCIIPGKDSGLAVDFDGDRVLSLVLSKAFLLADDTKITDPVILAQLGR